MYGKYGDNFNIAREVVEMADKYGLDFMSTGGGFDYVFKKTGKNDYNVAILCDNIAGGSPENINNNCSVNIYIDENWINGVEIIFPNCKRAMEFMQSSIINCFGG
jgi:hypothetical protein